MPSQTVIVHDDAEFRTAAAEALISQGYFVAVYEDAMAAMTAMRTVGLTELLITRLRFAEGRGNGIALALMVKRRNARVRVIFTAPPELREHAGDLGMFLEMPVPIPKLVETVRQELSTQPHATA